MYPGDLATIANETAETVVTTVETVETVETYVETTNGPRPAVGGFDMGFDGFDSFDGFDTMYYIFDPQYYR